MQGGVHIKGVHLSPLGFAACQSKNCTNRAEWGVHLSLKGVHLSQVHQQNYWCTSCRGCTCLKCTNRTNDTLLAYLMHFLLTWYTTTWLVHLRQVHPLKAPPESPYSRYCTFSATYNE